MDICCARVESVDEAAGIRAVKPGTGDEQADILRIALDESIDQQQPGRNSLLRCRGVVLIEDAGGQIVRKMLARLVDDAGASGEKAGHDENDC